MGWIALHTEVDVEDPHLTLAWWPKHHVDVRDKRALALLPHLQQVANRPVEVETKGRLAFGKNGSVPCVGVVMSQVLTSLRQIAREVSASQLSWTPHVALTGDKLITPPTYLFKAIGIHTGGSLGHATKHHYWGLSGA